MPFQIRPGLESDLDTIVDFNCRLARETENKTLQPDVVRAGVLAALKDPVKGPYFLALEGHNILGQLQLTYEWSDWRNGWIWWIQGVYVRAEARKRGVFRSLFEHVLMEAKSDNQCIGLRLYVEKQNSRAQKTYEALGMLRAPYDLYEQLWISEK